MVSSRTCYLMFTGVAAAQSQNCGWLAIQWERSRCLHLWVPDCITGRRLRRSKRASPTTPRPDWRLLDRTRSNTRKDFPGRCVWIRSRTVPFESRWKQMRGVVSEHTIPCVYPWLLMCMHFTKSKLLCFKLTHTMSSRFHCVVRSSYLIKYVKHKLRILLFITGRIKQSINQSLFHAPRPTRK